MAADPDLLLAILDSLPVMVGYWDLDLCNRMATTAYVEWFGRTAEEMPGIHIRELLGPELYEVDLPHMERALAGEKQLFDRTVVDGRSASRHTHVSYIPDIADEPFDEVGTLTISAGVCDLSSTRDYGDLIEDADKALYAAKRAGRNRTVSTGDN